MHISSLVFLSGIVAVTAFFGSRGSSQEPPSDFVRGAPELEEYRKTSATFTCLDKSASLNFSKVNDDYCDCPDGSDEPGTSACYFRFLCTNKGYRSLSIPSSRVEDRVCDCCDGSDETSIKCPNVCASLAKEEHQRTETIAAEFRQGRQVRTAHEVAARSRVESLRAQLEKLREEGQQLNLRVNETTAVYDIEKQFETEINAQLLSNASRDIHNALSLHDLEERSLAQFISHLLNLLNLGETDVKEIQASIKRGEKWKREDPGRHDPAPVEDEDLQGEHHEDYEDYGDESHHEMAHDNDQSELGEVPGCGADKVTADTRLQMLICDGGDDALHTLRSLLVHLIRSQQTFHEVQTVLGYYKIHGSFDGIQQFIQSSPPMEGTCPAEFATLPGICEMPHQLKSIVNDMDVSFSSEEAGRAKELMDTAVRLRDENIRSRREVKEQVRLYDSLEVNGHGALLEMKGKCFSIKDGKFEYEVCFLGSIYQTSLEQANSKTLLGSFSSVKETAEGDILLLYEQGQHCHAFGARKASVLITCGRADEVLEAREPSTCSYSFRMKSPLACTAKYGVTQGLF